MRRLYNDFFGISEHGRISEKAMLMRISVTIIIMLLCLAAMSFSAFAYFSHDITSSANIIKAASFEAKVSVHTVNTNGTTTPVSAITSNYKSHKAFLEAGNLYTVTVSPTENNSAKTGFIIVSAANCNEVYHTQQIGVDTNVSR